MNDATDGPDSKTEAPLGAAGPTGGPRVRFDASNLKSSYSNVCTMNITREEVVMNFGLNQSWERGQQELAIELTNRVILSPFAAMRLLEMLRQVMRDYEARYGTLKPEIPRTDDVR